ncbi:MAG: alpha/beta hydrolase [Deltaproteobacteria bacterium]|nr:MAG: alpha/beta hydrolase [Deltaproteobacteria bacterium]
MTELTRTSTDGTHIHAQLWEPEVEVKADLLLVHGLGEHIARYEHVARAFNAHGIRVRGVDVRGHGRSGGKQGFVERWHKYHDDIETVAKEIPGRFFVYGHSMGSIITMDWLRANEDRVQAAAISAPPFEPAVKVPMWKAQGAKILTRVWPSLQLDNELSSDMICTDRAVVDAYEADPLVHHWATPRWLTEFNAARGRIGDHVGRYTTPLLITWGTEDPIISDPAARQFGSDYRAEIELLPRSGLKHEVHNEPGNDAFTREIAGWMLAHLDGAPAQG